MPINKELLIQVRDRILAEPEHFDMDEWYADGPCGTTACIAGWAASIATVDDLVGMRLYSRRPALLAVSALKLNRDERDRLFWVDEWPQPFRDRYEQAKPKRRAQVAADRIDLFIATEGME